MYILRVLFFVLLSFHLVFFYFIISSLILSDKRIPLQKEKKVENEKTKKLQLLYCCILVNLVMS
jgi:hypothetical protein